MKKPTLQIKAFTGVDRRSDGTVTPDNQFFSMSNWHQKSLGELESLKGVIQKNASALPGVGEVIHTAFHKNVGEDTKALIFFKPSITGDSDFGQGSVTSADFAVSGTGVNHYFQVTFTGAGGLYKSIDDIGPIDGGNPTTSRAVTFDPDLTSVPGWVCQVNVYWKFDASVIYQGIFIGSLTRVNGVFPSTLNARSAPVASYTVNQDFMAIPDHLQVINTAGGGELLPNKVYYLGVAPFMGSTTAELSNYPFPRVRLYSSGNASPQTVLTLILPNEDSQASTRFYFAHSTTNYQVAGVDLGRLWAFVGQAPEDLLLCSKNDEIGSYNPIAIDNNNYALSGGSYYAGSDSISKAGMDNIIDDGSPVHFSGTPVAGITNVVYWLKYIGTDEARLATSLDNLRNGVFIDITATSTFGAQEFRQSTVDFIIDHLPVNTNNNVNMTKSYLYNFGSSSLTKQLGGTNQQGDPFRLDGAFINGLFHPNIDQTTVQRRYLQGFDYSAYPLGSGGSGLAADNIGCWVFDSFDMNPEDGYQLLANISDRNFSKSGQSKVDSGYSLDPPIGSTSSYLSAPDISPSLFWAPDDSIMDTEQFTIRTYCSNGDNSLFCTDGYAFKPIIRDFGAEAPDPVTYTPRIPTCKYITSFQSRLVAAGGDPSFQNAPNQVYYSEADNPFAWGVAGAAANSINVFSARPINGLGSYSQNLLDSGFASFLVVSKEDGLFTWDGNTANGPTQLYYSFGFAGPRAFAVTNAGPLFVAQDSIYLLAGDKIIPVVDELEHVLRDLTKEQLAKISAVFHNEKFKFAYSSAANNELDTEWWFEQSTFQGKPVKYISGPHTLKPFTSQASTISFAGEREVRISGLAADVYQRDSGKVNDGVSITRTIVLSRLGLQEDHALKLLEEVFLAVKIEADETFDVAIGVEDGGTLTYSGTMTGSVAVASRQLIQHFVSQRILGRVNKLTITNTSSNSVSLFDISLIFTPKGRRLFR